MNSRWSVYLKGIGHAYDCGPAAWIAAAMLALEHGRRVAILVREDTDTLTVFGRIA